MMNVYLDFQASTPLDPRVLDTMLPWLPEAANRHASGLVTSNLVLTGPVLGVRENHAWPN